MVEQVNKTRINVVESPKPLLSGTDLVYLQCTALGWSDIAINNCYGINCEQVKAGIADKMISDTAFRNRLAQLSRLPFVPEGFLTPAQGMVAFLTQAGLRSVEIARTLEIQPSNVVKYKRRMRAKELLKKDQDVPGFVNGRNSHKVGLNNALYYAFENRLLDTTLISTQPEKPLSYFESRFLLYRCYGLSTEEISDLTGKAIHTVKTVDKRGRKKLGAKTRNEYIARGIVEIMRLTPA